MTPEQNAVIEALKEKHAKRLFDSIDASILREAVDEAVDIARRERQPSDDEVERVAREIIWSGMDRQSPEDQATFGGIIAGVGDLYRRLARAAIVAMTPAPLPMAEDEEAERTNDAGLALALASDIDAGKLPAIDPHRANERSIISRALHEFAAMTPAAEVERLRILETAARALLDDVRRRHPGEDLRCPLMRAVDEALALPAPPSGDPKP